MTSTINKTNTGSIEITITVPWDVVEKTYDAVLIKTTEDTELPGFRKGKAPKEKVEESIGKTKLFEEVIRQLLPTLYTTAIKEHNVKPIVSPQITLKEAKEKEPWVILAVTCERPTVTLGDYKKAITDLKAEKAKKIWLPGQEKTPEKEEDKKPSLDELLSAILKTVTITIPTILIEQEVNRLLSDLIDQTKKLGMTVDQYLASSGKTADTIRKEYENQAKQTIALEFALEDIADSEHIQVSDEDINKVIAGAKSEEEKKSLDQERYYIATILRRQETMKYLASL